MFVDMFCRGGGKISKGVQLDGLWTVAARSLNVKAMYEGVKKYTIYSIDKPVSTIQSSRSFACPEAIRKFCERSVPRTNSCGQIAMVSEARIFVGLGAFE